MNVKRKTYGTNCPQDNFTPLHGVGRNIQCTMVQLHSYIKKILNTTYTEYLVKLQLLDSIVVAAFLLPVLLTLLLVVDIILVTLWITIYIILGSMNSLLR